MERVHASKSDKQLTELKAIRQLLQTLTSQLRRKGTHLDPGRTTIHGHQVIVNSKVSGTVRKHSTG
jgi:hypothetical protein